MGVNCNKRLEIIRPKQDRSVWSSLSWVHRADGPDPGTPQSLRHRKGSKKTVLLSQQDFKRCSIDHLLIHLNEMIQLEITKHLRLKHITQIPRAWKCPSENRFRARFSSQPNTYYSWPFKFAATLNLTLSGCLWALFGKAFAGSPRKLFKENPEARFWNRGRIWGSIWCEAGHIFLLKNAFNACSKISEMVVSSRAANPRACDIGSCIISSGTVETCMNYTTAWQDTAYCYNWHISCMLNCLVRDKIVVGEVMPHCTTKMTMENPNGPDRFIKATCYRVLCGIISIPAKSDRAIEINEA